MANRKKTNEVPRSLSKNARRHVGEVIFSSSSSSEEAEPTAASRGCKNTLKERFTRNRPEGEQSGQDGPRREENPFSFIHFLKIGAQPNNCHTGARPKVYPSPTSSPDSLEKDTGVYSRNPTELPDFVQDHLVIEQCYLNHDCGQQAPPEIDNLPDFALNSVEHRQTRLRNEAKKCEPSVLCDLPFDLTGSIDKGSSHRDHSVPSTACSPHLDLPMFERPTLDSHERPERLDATGFPLDLPIPLAEPDSNVNIATRDCPVTNDASVPKSLPDFLSDGPIHNRTSLSVDPGPSSNIGDSIERQLIAENNRLRHKLQLAWVEISEKTNRIRLLESELASRKEVEHEETAHLEKAMEQVEDNLKRSTKRAVSAESTVTSLKKEIKTLTTEISLLRLQNKELKAGMSASNADTYGSSSNLDHTIRRLATDLRTAASSAEISLRQLMSGVDNLRLLASTLENVDRIEDRTKDFLPDYDEDNAAGPAL
ncbi:hypothetical protein KM043_018491 [Ampulex compressa]|nr:hypothetical protein KM043_018491 [Ampulex compressa]